MKEINRSYKPKEEVKMYETEIHDKKRLEKQLQESSSNNPIPKFKIETPEGGENAVIPVRNSMTSPTELGMYQVKNQSGNWLPPFVGLKTAMGRTSQLMFEMILKESQSEAETNEILNSEIVLVADFEENGMMIPANQWETSYKYEGGKGEENDKDESVR